MSSINYDPALSLNLGCPPTTAHNPPPHQQQSLPGSDFNLSLTLSLSASTVACNRPYTNPTHTHQNHQATSPRSGVSSLSLSNGTTPTPVPTVATGKRRERDPPMPAASGTASEEVDRNHSSKSAAGSDDEEEELVGGGGAHSNVRKKLRLTKDQSALLEESFKLHSTLNPKQKTALAKQLNLRPRQVEVWFQNRRARTKFKQTEVDCEFLKKWCESLTNENRRLQKEVQELRALKVAAAAQPPFYMQLPAATLTMCPSCERITSATSTTAAAAGGEVRRR